MRASGDFRDLRGRDVQDNLDVVFGVNRFEDVFAISGSRTTKPHLLDVVHPV